MLVLMRKTGTSITIGDEIEIIILSTNRKQVRVGIKAPKKIEVHRKEIYDRLHAEKSHSNLDDNEKLVDIDYINENQKNNQEN